MMWRHPYRSSPERSVPMARFEATTSAPEPGRLVVRLAGECDLQARERLESTLLAAVGTAPTVVVDAAELEFLDSTGVNGLVVAHHAAQERGGRLYLVGAQGVVAEVLDVTGVGALLSPAD